MQTVYVCLDRKEWGGVTGDSKIGLVVVVHNYNLGESPPVWPPSDWKDDGGRPRLVAMTHATTHK